MPTDADVQAAITAAMTEVTGIASDITTLSGVATELDTKIKGLEAGATIPQDVVDGINTLSTGLASAKTALDAALSTETADAAPAAPPTS